MTNDKEKTELSEEGRSAEPERELGPESDSDPRLEPDGDVEAQPSDAVEGVERDDDEPWKPDIDPLASAEDAIDPDLLAIAEEKPAIRWHRPVVMAVVCLLIVVMMVWFWEDLLYFFGDGEPIDLGDGHDITFRDEWENRYVRLSAVPLAPRNENPSPQCGALQGFPTYQRRLICRGHQSAIPVMGRPGHDLIIQRYMVRQLRISYYVAEGREADELLGGVMKAALRVSAVHAVRPTEEGELGHLVVDVEGQAGQTDLDVISKSLSYEIEASVPGIKRVMVERVRREIPGEFEGRLVRLRSLGTRFAAVADYLNQCTSYPVSEDAWVVLDGSEAGDGLVDGLGMCYGQRPRQYWTYLVLYVLLASILVVNVGLLVRFLRVARKRS